MAPLHPDIEREAEALLRPRPVRAPELVAAIHAVNPTGQGLPAKLERQRYALKSRLQSRLLLDFFDDIAIEPVPTEPGVISLRYRPEDRDACHAILSELSLDARSRVQLHLDTREEAVPAGRGMPVAPTKKKAPRPGLLTEGRAALAEYDFDRARGLFEEALEGAADDGAAVALLELHIDSLAGWQDALAVEARLSPRQLTPPVRALLAHAAAQAGDVVAFRRLSKELQGPRVAAAFCVLAEAALKRGELPEAAQLLADARRLDVVAPELIGLEGELARLKAAERGPAERALEERAATGDLEGAAAEAEVLLQRWPESSVARRVLRDAEARRTAARLDALQKDAGRAFEGGDDEAALRLWGEAVALGAKGLESRLKQTQERLESRRYQARLDGVVAALQSGVGAASLSEYLRLEPSARHRVRALVPDEALVWLEFLASDGPEREHPADVAAVLALREVSGRAPAATAVLEVLRPFEARIKRLEAGRAVWAQATAQLQREAQQAAASQLEAAQAALGRGDWPAAIELAEGLFDVGERTLAEAARGVATSARRRVASARLSERYQQLLAADAPIEVLRLIGEAERTEGEDGPLWAARRVQLAPRLRQAFRVESSASPGDLHFADFAYGFAPQELSFALDAAGEHFYWATTLARHLFIRKVSVSEQRVIQTVALLTPTALEFPSVLVEGERLWVTQEGGATLQLSTRTWDVLQWHVDAHDGETEVAERALLVPGGRYLWISVRPRGGNDETVRIIDLERGRVQREMPGRELATIECVVTPLGPRVFVPRFGREGRLFSAAGAGEESVPEGVRLLSAWPLGEGLVALRQPGDALDEVDGEDAEPLSILRLRAHGGTPEFIEALSDSFNDGVSFLATSLRAQAAFVSYADTDGHRWLVGYGSSDASVRRRWRVQTDFRPLLLQDTRAERVCFAAPSREGVRCALLTADSPGDLLGDTPAGEAALPRLPKHSLMCNTPGWSSECARLAESIHRQPTAEARKKALAQALEAYAQKPESLVQLANSLRSWKQPEAAAEATRLATRDFPSHPLVHLDAAEASMEQGAWEEALAALDRLPPEGLQALGSHPHHLRGLALYRLRRFVDARAAFVIAGATGSTCRQVAGWPEWLDALQAGDGSAETEAGRLLGWVRDADRAFEAGEPAKALALLDVTAVWRCLDVQLCARLLVAALARDEPGVRQRLRLIAAAYVELRESRYAAALPLGHLQWSDERLAEVEQRARGWLAAA